MDHNQNQSAARAARRFLDDRVRTDWSWPDEPAPWDSDDDGGVRGARELRERYYASSESASDAAADAAAEVPAPAPAVDPYKFDSPESIGDALETTLQGRNRSRQQAVEAEMGWNEGLACYVQRRDAWTGAAAVRNCRAHRPATSPPSDPAREDTPAKEASSPQPPNDPSVALVPLAPPLLPDNPLRKAISPKAYPDIYTKIVLASRTPTVPINLGDVTKAMVQGWKDNGEWPPKAAPLDPLAGRKRGLVSVKLDNGDGPFLTHHPHVKKGMDSVKRIFHLNGGHHHEEGLGTNG
ncbi:hypothetical protein BDV95DRAFT_584933 [Massariosphaeria phaeospora]|uniref:Gag1-like clamp domain-containing protein n=1 Tax=Massariosphaeria phaeospora TaxID=100035 RepID=A0A7C8M0K0_9PLEO|nr:hypothetical protein BDV95DRAFT_584933 [Massariosphaeria phaeospora]